MSFYNEDFTLHHVDTDGHYSHTPVTQYGISVTPHRYVDGGMAEIMEIHGLEGEAWFTRKRSRKVLSSETLDKLRDEVMASEG